MDVILAKRDLLRLVQRASNVADKRSTMPVLANVLLQTENGALRVSATDNYLSLTGAEKADIGRPGAIALPAKGLADRIKAMPEGPIQITVKDKAQAALKAVGSPRRYTLQGIPGDEFPKLPEAAEGAHKISLSAENLAQLIAQTHFAISPDETRAHINSALLDVQGETVRMVSTDGHRLSKSDIAVPGSSAKATMLLPLKAILELRKLV
jgi:DNA polymerase-3 subunit beta